MGLKIIVTVHTYWPMKNGVQYVTQYLCEGLAAKGHDITVLTTVSDPTKAGSERYNGVRIVREYLETHYSVIHQGTRGIRECFKREAQHCDCVICCCVQSPINNILLPLLEDVSALKVLYMHGMHDFRRPVGESVDLKYQLWHTFMNVRWGLFYSYNRKRFARFDVIVDIHKSSPGLDFMKRLGVDAPQYVITNAVEEFDSAVATDDDMLRYPVLGEDYFLYVASFNERKNQRALVKAFGEVTGDKKKKLVLIGGRSEYGERVKSDISSYGLVDRVIVYEDQDRSITRKFIKNCFCGIMSSRFEVYPIFLCEVISCGHPYISTDVGCVREIPGGDIVESLTDLTAAMTHMIEDDFHREVLRQEGALFARDNLSQQSKINQLESMLLKECAKEQSHCCGGLK